MTDRYVSLKEVAALAGVSFQTASKVLNGGPIRVSKETSTRIFAAADQLGYTPNVMARALVSRSTMTIGLLTGGARDPALGEFAFGVELAARRQGHSVLVGNLSASEGDGAEVVRALLARRVDGIVVAAPQLEEDLEVAELVRRYVPAVRLNHVPGGGVPLVGSNHREVGRLALDHLVSIGRRRIGTIAGPFRRRVVRSRLRGAEERLVEAGVEPEEDLVVEADWSPAGAASATLLLAERVPGIDALFVHSDVMAIGVLFALRAMGRQVPDEVAVVSCDDLDFAAYLCPPLTTVHLPFLETGEAAVELLLRRIRRESVAVGPMLLPIELVVRESSMGVHVEPSLRAGSASTAVTKKRMPL